MLNRRKVEGNFKLHLYTLLMSVVVAGCAASSPRFKSDSDLLFSKIMGSEAATLFPVELQDIYVTLQQGDSEYSRHNIENANKFYQLAIGKIVLLEKQHLNEVKLREEAARLELEKREEEAAEELRRVKAMERERAEEAARTAAIAKKIEAEKAEARKRAERRSDVSPALTHTVKRGETLPQIAALAEVYGESALWPLLYRANRDQISNPAVLWPGQVLRIPRNYDRSDLSEARKYSTDRQIR